MRPNPLAALAFLAACTQPSTEGGDSAGDTGQTGTVSWEPLRVATFNADWLWSSYGAGEIPRNQTDYQMIGRLLTDNGLELVGLQEIDGPQAVHLLELEGDWEWVTGESGWNQNVAIAWRDDRVSVTNAREVELPSFRDANKKPLVADVQSRSGDLAFTLAVIHHKPFSNDEDSRERQTQAAELYAWLGEKLALSTDGEFVDNIVVMGDFNDTFEGINPDYPSLVPFTADPGWDFATAHTPHFTQISYRSQIDHIGLYGPVRDRQPGAGTAEGIHVFPHEQTPPWSDYAGGQADPEPSISDHRALWVGLEHSPPQDPG